MEDKTIAPLEIKKTTTYENINSETESLDEEIAFRKTIKAKITRATAFSTLKSKVNEPKKSSLTTLPLKTTNQIVTTSTSLEELSKS